MDTKSVLQLPIEDLIPNRFQPRLAFDDASLNELADSIKEHGIIQPIVVRRVNDKYEIIAGERRYRAAKKSGLISVPAIISELNDNESAEVAIVENVQRKDLTAIEEAKSYKALLDQNLMSQEDLARKMGLSQSAISNKLRLLSLDAEVQDAILAERISERHARSLLKLKDNAKQKEMLERILSSRLTVKQLEEEIKKITGDVPTLVKEEINEEKGEDMLNGNAIFSNKQKKDYPNKFFNFLESEDANMDTAVPEIVSEIKMENEEEDPLSIIPEEQVEPVVEEEIEMLDDFDISVPVNSVINEPVVSEVKSNKVLEEIKEFLNKYPNVQIEHSDNDTTDILTIKIPKDN